MIMRHNALLAVATGVEAHFATVFLFLLFGIFFAFLALGIAKLVRPQRPNPAKLTTYECGELPQGSSWVRFNIRFYLIALFFIVFDVEVVFLFPWAVVFRQLLPVHGLGPLVFWEMVVFLAILAVGLAYVWAKGDLDWVKSLTARGRDGSGPAAPVQEGLEESAVVEEVGQR
jgi:NADH-quinone oxidoreductase subunit A